jgi:hypothetical protein
MCVGLILTACHTSIKCDGLSTMHTELANMHMPDGLNIISWTWRRPTASVFQVSVRDIMV